MGSVARAQAPSSPVSLTIISGPHRGQSFMMKSHKLKIGRELDNDLALPDDPKVSRHHAEIRLMASGVHIQNLSERNGLLVDGQPSQSAILRNGSVLSLGDTEIQFEVQAPQVQSHQHLGPASPSRRQRRPTPKKPTLTTWLIVAILAGVTWYLTQEEPKKTEALRLRTAEEVQAEIERAEQLRAEAQKQTNINGSTALQQAEERYSTGFRDYQRGRYGRAVNSFQACLSFDPSHALCQRYLRLAQKKQDELIQRLMVLGREYRDRNQFDSCVASFKNVMILVKDRQHPTYMEAKANYEACVAALKGRG